MNKAIATIAAAAMILGSLTACGKSATRICVTKTEIRRVSDHNCNPNIDDAGGVYRAVYIPDGQPVPEIGKKVEGEYHTSNPDYD